MLADELDPIWVVWACYVEQMEPRNRDLDPAARAVIREALKVASAEECCRAIQGCKASAFHMGDNDRHKKYNALTQILKGKRGGRTTREQIDFFLDIAEKLGVQSRFTSVDPAKVSQRKRDVLDAWEFPGNEHARRQGLEAEEWLREHGIEVERAEGGRPQFRQVDP